MKIEERYKRRAMNKTEDCKSKQVKEKEAIVQNIRIFSESLDKSHSPDHWRILMEKSFEKNLK